jgi:glucosamine 6-phosphate synthetase-like amidotransferase/phosphosugar isomerase protein
MVRECELAYITRAGVEIGVASTKAFTTNWWPVPADAGAGPVRGR